VSAALRGPEVEPQPAITAAMIATPPERGIVLFMTINTKVTRSWI
jgi:hypothetical protein